MPDPTTHKLYGLALRKTRDPDHRKLLKELADDVSAWIQPHLEVMRLWGDHVDAPAEVKLSLRDQDRGNFGATLELLQELRTEDALIRLLVETESAQLRNYKVMRRAFPAQHKPRLEELILAGTDRLDRLQALTPSRACSVPPPVGASDLPV